MRRYFTKRVRIIALIATAVMLAPVVLYAAAPSLPSVGTAVYPMTFHVSGSQSATKANVVKFNAPFPLRLLWATASAQAKTGSNVNSHGTTNIVVNNAGTLASSAIDLGNPAAAVVAEGTIVSAQGNVAVNTAVTADLTVWGSSPTISDITLVIWVQRR